METIIKTKRDGQIVLKDNGGANTLVVAFEQGDLNIGIPGTTIVSTLDRGRFGATPSLRAGDDQACTFSFTAYLRDLSDAAEATLEDLISGRNGKAADWVSTQGATADVFALTLQWSIAGAALGGTDHTLTLNHCVVTGSFSEGDPSTISITGTAYDLYPTVT
jgi:hypothetical protein